MIRNILFICLVIGVASGQFGDDEFEEEIPSTHVPQMLSEPLTVESTAGETVLFPCEVYDLGDYTLLWKKGVQNVLFAGTIVKIVRDSRFSLVGTNLQIQSVQPRDHGEYICQISTTPALEVKHTLNVLYPPTVKPQPRDGFITAKEGETVSLSCEAKGNPPPKVTWKHAGRNYDENGGKAYIISNIQKSAAGEYECIADNGVGDPAKAIITVEVVSAPKINAHPSSGRLVVKEGESIEIACEATGDPVPVITWKKPGGGDKASKGRDGDRIIITDADRSHSGIYECIANNSLGIFTSAVIHVQVQYPPEIKVPNAWIHAGEGSNINLTCTVKGEPMPSVMWKRGDKVIHSNEHYQLKSNNHHHILQIHHLKEEDFGRYDCVASNLLSTKTEALHIIGTPQVPVFTSKPHGAHGNRFMLNWVVKSHTPIDEYSLIYRKKAPNVDWTKHTIASSEDAKVHHEGRFELKELEPATTYEAVVTARNKFGWSKQSEAFIFSTKHSEKRSGQYTGSSSQIYSSWLVIAVQTVLVFMCVGH